MNYIVSEYRVLKTPAGFYVGRHCIDPTMPEAGCNIPHARVSGYFQYQWEAAELIPGYMLDDCEDALEQAAVYEYLQALASDVGIERAVHDALTTGRRKPGRVDEPSVHVDGPELCDAPADRVPGPVYEPAVPCN